MRVGRLAEAVYIVFLAAVLGAVLTLGAVVAPVIFHSERFLQQEILSHYQEGLIMTAIFLKTNYILNFAAFVILIREIYDYKRFKRDLWILLSATTALFSIFMFTLYYTPDIVAYQIAGEEMTKSEIFAKIHKGSEIDFSLLALSLAVLAVRRAYLLKKG